MIGTFMVPEWGSYVGFFFFGALSCYLFRARRHMEVVEKR